MQKSLLFVILIGWTFILPAQPADIVRRFEVPQAQQAVAVDEQHFYVINNDNISKHRKTDGALIQTWQDEDSVLHHLNSGIVIDGRLYCTNSNFPESPMASSIEWFDPETMTHAGNHSFGIWNGSATWIDLYQGDWYVAFAHYTGDGSSEGKDNRWTRLARFDAEWRQVESWIFPKKLIEHFGTRSNSGGFILDGRIYCTGHDEPELYVLEFPEKGYELRWVDTIPVGSKGQGIALDRQEERLIYGIDRDNSEIIITRLED